MPDNYEKVAKISNEGYKLEFGTILEDAFNNYKKIAGIAGITSFLLTIIIFGLLFGLIGAIYGLGDLQSVFTSLNPAFMTGKTMLVMLFVSVVMAAITTPFSAGVLKMAYNAHHNREFGIGTAFEYYKTSYFKDLFISAAILAFISNGCNYLLTYLGVDLLGILISYVILFLTFLTVPLIIFSNLQAIQAINMSVKLVLKQPLLLLGLLIVAIIFVGLGVFGLCIGIFFTVPFLYSMYFTIYAAIIPSSEKDLLDEIGQHEE